MTEWVEQWICIKFYIKLEHSSVETIQMIQKATAMGTWWLAASSQQCICSCITSHAESFGKTSNHPGDSVLLQPRFGALQLLAFPQTKITFEKKEILDCWWDSGNYNRAAVGNWEHCVRSQGAYFEGDLNVTVLWTMCLVSYIFFNKCLYFLYYMAGYPLGKPGKVYVYLLYFLCIYYWVYILLQYLNFDEFWGWFPSLLSLYPPTGLPPIFNSHENVIAQSTGENAVFVWTCPPFLWRTAQAWGAGTHCHLQTLVRKQTHLPPPRMKPKNRTLYPRGFPNSPLDSSPSYFTCWYHWGLRPLLEKISLNWRDTSFSSIWVN